MKLISVKIHQFRSIINLEFPLNNYQVLVGSNNAGKTNIITAIRWFYGDMKVTLDDFPKYGKQDNKMYVECTFETTSAIVGKQRKRKIRTKTYRRECLFEGDTIKSAVYYKIAKRKGEPKKVAHIEDKIGSLVYIPAFVNLNTEMSTNLTSSAMQRLLSLILVDKLERKNSQITKQLKGINQSLQIVKKVFSRVTDELNGQIANWGVKLLPKVDALNEADITRRLINIGYCDSSINQEVPFEKFGAGFQRFAVGKIIQQIAKPQRTDDRNKFTLLLFEEPEVFLHSTVQCELAQDLQTISNKTEMQVVITTHSSFFVERDNDGPFSLIKISKAQQTLAQMFDQDSFDKGYQSFLQENLGITQNERYEEKLRFKVFLDTERANLFFAQKVLVVEGATERVLLAVLHYPKNAPHKSRGRPNLIQRGFLGGPAAGWAPRRASQPLVDVG